MVRWAGVNGAVSKLSREESHNSCELLMHRPAKSGRPTSGLTRPVWGGHRANSTRFGPLCFFDLGRNRPNSGRARVEFGSNSADFGRNLRSRIRPKLRRARPTLAEIGSRSVESGPTRSEQGHVWADFGRNTDSVESGPKQKHRTRSKSSQIWPKSAPNRSSSPGTRPHPGQVCPADAWTSR